MVYILIYHLWSCNKCRLNISLDQSKGFDRVGGCFLAAVLEAAEFELNPAFRLVFCTGAPLLSYKWTESTQKLSRLCSQFIRVVFYHSYSMPWHWNPSFAHREANKLTLLGVSEFPYTPIILTSWSSWEFSKPTMCYIFVYIRQNL